MAKRIAIVAQFHKSAGGRFDLWSLTTISEEPAKDGSGDVRLLRNYYDVDWSRNYGYLYHQSGAGGSRLIPVEGIYFTSGDVQIEERPCTLCERSKTTGRWTTRKIRARNKTRRLHTLPKFFRLERDGDLFDWLEVNGIDSESVYCSECKDCFPEDELCKHCWWCYKIGWFSTPGERCKCKDREKCDGG